MPRKLVVLNVVGLTPAAIGDDTPALKRLADEGFRAELGTVLPAVTCAAQSTFLTGRLPREHGVVANGWYFRDLAEVWLWRQSNRLVTAPKVWERLRQRLPGFTCAKLFWWFNMYSSADWSVTPRPVYHADGRKSSSIYTQPAALKPELDRALGPFPLFEFWGPGAGIGSSAWIGACARHVIERQQPDLTLVYLPHLDYDLQRHGPDHPRSRQALRDIDAVCGELIDTARSRDSEVIVLSEYGITGVERAVSLNRGLRRQGWLQVQETIAGELLDAGASRAFAVADHQVAHIYVAEPGDLAPVRQWLEGVDGVETVLDEEGKRAAGLDHPRSGELVAVASPGRWFDYYYWLDDARAPDFARTVDIHRKPGYDPVELFLDPQQNLVKGRIACKLLAKKFGFRTILDVIPLDSSLVRGSHGRLPTDADSGPVLLCSSPSHRAARFEATDVADLIESICAGE